MISNNSNEGNCNLYINRPVPGTGQEKRYKGVRCRRWGKWVSEIRVPQSKERLWLGMYSTPQGAAIAHDVASYCLRGEACLSKLNFPSMLPQVDMGLSPRSVQKVASDAGMAMDARFITSREVTTNTEALNVSVDDYL